MTTYRVTLDFRDGTSREVIVDARSRHSAAMKASNNLKMKNLKTVTPRELQA